MAKAYEIKRFEYIFRDKDFKAMGIKGRIVEVVWEQNRYENRIRLITEYSEPNSPLPIKKDDDEMES